MRRIIWKIIWHSVYFFLKRPPLLIFCLLFILLWLGAVFVASVNKPEFIKSEKSFSANGKKQPPFSTDSLPEIIGNTDDGDSVFARDLFAIMQPEEKQSYGMIFNYAMQNLKKDEKYQWRRGSMFGYIIMKDDFRSKNGTLCRNYQELLKVQNAAQKFNGFACRHRNNNGWCRLRKGSAPTCEIGIYEPGTWEKITDWFK